MVCGARGWSSVTLSWQGFFCRHSADTLSNIGLTRNDIKLISVKCIQGGVHCHKRHCRMTTVC